MKKKIIVSRLERILKFYLNNNNLQNDVQIFEQREEQRYEPREEVQDL